MYDDRFDAGRQLAEKLSHYAGLHDGIVLALPRGGVEVGYEVARALHLPLDVIISRKLGFPDNPEFGIGAISENGAFFLDKPTVEILGLKKKEIELIKFAENRELERRVALYRKGNKLSDLTDKTVILVDDGLATGVTALAAILSIKFNRPKKIVFASPVCAYDSAETVSKEVDHVICSAKPHDLRAVGLYYKNFDQVSDDKVVDLLEKSRRHFKSNPISSWPRYAM